MTSAASLLNSAAQPSLAYVAGAAILANDLLMLKEDSKVYPVTATSQIAYPSIVQGIASTVATGRIAAAPTPSSVLGGAASPGGNTAHNGHVNRHTAIDATGNLYSLVGYVADNTNGGGFQPVGARLIKTSPAGVQLGYVDISSTTGVMQGPCVKVLSNGNIAVLWGSGAADFTTLTNLVLTYAVYTGADTPVVVKALTVLASPAGVNNGDVWDLLALAAGGFAIAESIITTHIVQLSIYDNSGNVVTAAATIFTPTGAVAYTYPRLCQFTNGSIGVSIHNTSATNYGHYVGVYSILGVQITAMTAMDTASNTTPYAHIHNVLALGNVMAVVYAMNAVVYYRVFSNVGAALFARTAIPDVTYLIYLSSPLYTDGTNFFIVGASPATYAGIYKLLAASASATLVYTSATVTIAGSNYGGGYVASKHIMMNGPSGLFDIVDDLVTPGTLASRASGTATLTATASSLGGPLILPSATTGRFWVVARSYNAGANPPLNRCLYNLTPVAVVGVAKAAQATIGQNVEVNVGAYMGPINAITGGAGQGLGGFAFNHAPSGVVPTIIGTRGIVWGTTAKLVGLHNPDARHPFSVLVSAAVPYYCPAGYRMEFVASNTFSVNGVSNSIPTSMAHPHTAVAGDVLGVSSSILTGHLIPN